MRIGWLSTGRDQAASNLLADVVARAQQDGVDLDIACVLCDRERGEAPESDHFLDLVDRLGFRERHPLERRRLARGAGAGALAAPTGATTSTSS